MAEGFHSLQAFWLGGAGTDSATVGFHSLLAFWMGGAGVAVSGFQPAWALYSNAQIGMN